MLVQKHILSNRWTDKDSNNKTILYNVTEQKNPKHYELKHPNKYEHSRYGVDHVQTHLDAAVGVVSLGLGQSGHTVVTIPQDFNPATVVLLPNQT